MMVGMLLWILGLINNIVVRLFRGGMMFEKVERMAKIVLIVWELGDLGII